MPANRSVALDVAKGILIILVVVGHGLQYAFGTIYANSGIYFNNLLYRAIYSFHMPLFMMISGYLFFFSNQKGVNHILKSKFETVFIPYVTYVTVYLLITLLLRDLKTCSLNGFYRILINEFWFLPSILFNCTIVCITTHLFKKRTIQSVLLILYATALLFINRYLPGTYIFMFSCFITGYFFNAYHCTLTSSKVRYWKLLLAILLFIICVRNFHYDIYVYTTSTSIWRDGHFSLTNLEIDIQRYVIGIVASVSFMVFISLHSYFSQKIISFLCNCGKYSLGIYGLSNLLYYVYQKGYDYFSINIPYNSLTPLLLAAFTIIVIYRFLQCCEKYHWFNYLFLGSRATKA